MKEKKQKSLHSDVATVVGTCKRLALALKLFLYIHSHFL